MGRPLEQTPELLIRQKIKAIKLRQAGFSCIEVANLLGCEEWEVRQVLTEAKIKWGIQS
jgi:transcriptional regulator